MTLTPLAIDLGADSDPRGTDDPVILASVVHSTRLNQVVALGNGGPTDPAELAGKRIGLMRGTNAEFDWSLLATLRRQFGWALEAGYGSETSTGDVLARIDARPLREIVPSATGIPYTDPGYEPAERQP